MLVSHSMRSFSILVGSLLTSQQVARNRYWMKTYLLTLLALGRLIGVTGHTTFPSSHEVGAGSLEMGRFSLPER
jgi:hypothetical protein